MKITWGICFLLPFVAMAIAEQGTRETEAAEHKFSANNILKPNDREGRLFDHHDHDHHDHHHHDDHRHHHHHHEHDHHHHHERF
ncbi:unnamed protein product [Allacma fusca]|uniref:Uncharacterized protein n=1 Tax=Allacma fusca TaxID=39272 RepID=A0A8J2J9A3_9HEXA|nr:unnamed protein product [Allacma fusca]